MAYCNEMDLLCGSPIEIPQVCTILPIYLSTFKGRGAATRYREYRQHLSLIAMTTEEIVASLSEVGVIGEQTKEDIDSVTQFDLLSSLFQEPFIRALSYFVEEKLSWDQQNLAFRCFGSNGALFGEMSRDTYPLIRNVILESNCITMEDESVGMQFSGSKSKSIFEKLLAGRKKKRKSGVSDKGPSIEDIISSVSVRSNGYTLLNIWDLTIYQLYDQFNRVSTNHQVDIIGLKWAAWGTEPFDFTLWYKNYKEDKNG